VTGGDPEREVASSRERFAQVAAAYRRSPSHRDPVALEAFLAIAELGSSQRVLDVATGAGHVAVAAAPRVRAVVGLDITEEMLEQARDLAAEHEVRSCEFVLGDAERLPFAEHSFDRVLVRAAPHHFRNLARACAEAFRVLRPGGAFCVCDTSPPPIVRDWLEHVEVRRDPSHVRARVLEEWRALLTAIGFVVEHAERIEQERDVLTWFGLMRVPEAVVRELLDYYDRAPQAVRGAILPQWNDGRFYHRYWHAMVRARRPLGGADGAGAPPTMRGGWPNRST